MGEPVWRSLVAAASKNKEVGDYLQAQVLIANKGPNGLCGGRWSPAMQAPYAGSALLVRKRLMLFHPAATNAVHALLLYSNTSMFHIDARVAEPKHQAPHLAPTCTLFLLDGG